MERKESLARNSDYMRYLLNLMQAGPDVRPPIVSRARALTQLPQPQAEKWRDQAVDAMLEGNPPRLLRELNSSETPGPRENDSARDPQAADRR